MSQEDIGKADLTITSSLSSTSISISNSDLLDSPSSSGSGKVTPVKKAMDNQFAKTMDLREIDQKMELAKQDLLKATEKLQAQENTKQNYIKRLETDYRPAVIEAEEQLAEALEIDDDEDFLKDFRDDLATAKANVANYEDRLEKLEARDEEFRMAKVLAMNVVIELETELEKAKHDLEDAHRQTGDAISEIDIRVREQEKRIAEMENVRGKLEDTVKELADNVSSLSEDQQEAAKALQEFTEEFKEMIEERKNETEELKENHKAAKDTVANLHAWKEKYAKDAEKTKKVLDLLKKKNKKLGEKVRTYLEDKDDVLGE